MLLPDEQVRAMSQRHEKPRLIPFPADAIDGLLATAARAPSIFNTQPWLFELTPCTMSSTPIPAAS